MLFAKKHRDIRSLKCGTLFSLFIRPSKIVLDSGGRSVIQILTPSLKDLPFIPLKFRTLFLKPWTKSLKIAIFTSTVIIDNFENLLYLILCANPVRREDFSVSCYHLHNIIIRKNESNPKNILVANQYLIYKISNFVDFVNISMTIAIIHTLSTNKKDESSCEKLPCSTSIFD